MSLLPHRILLLVALCVSGSTTAIATSISDIRDSGNLEVATSLSEHSVIVPGQRVKLVLETATNRWFTGGTRITLPEVPGLVILQNEQFASNASESRDGETWVTQRWELDVFPQRSGEFAIPPIALRLKVNTSDAESVEGILMAPGISFNVALPEGLRKIESWVAAPQFGVSERFDKSLQALRVGDAFEQTIEFQAADVMAMMLPGYAPAEQKGLAAYPAPPELANSINRGQSTAKRTVRISYVVEKNGQFILPARDYFWWDTRANKLQLLSLPATPIEVGTASPNTFSTDLWKKLVLAICIGCGILMCLALLSKLHPDKLLGLRSNRHIAALRWQIARLKALREPALPKNLNPGSSAAE